MLTSSLGFANMTIQLTPLLAASFSLFLRVLLATYCDYLPGLVAGGDEGFLRWPFLCIYENHATERAPFV